MQDEAEAGPLGLRPAVRVLACIVVSGLLLWALFTPVYYERNAPIFPGNKSTTSLSPTGIEALFPGLPPTGAGPLVLLLVPGWGVLIFTTRAVFQLALNRCEGALVACQWSLLLFVITFVVMGIMRAYAGAVVSVVSHTAEFRWGPSILIWLIGHGMLLEVSWLGVGSGIPKTNP